MLKKIFICVISVLLLFSLVACNDGEDVMSDMTDTNDTADTLDNSFVDIDFESLLNDVYSSEAYYPEDVDKILSAEELSEIIAKVPTDKYENYPDMHNIPLSAVLYKDGEEISIAQDDERLIAIINFFNNCAYYKICWYIQSPLSQEYLEENVTGAEFRLELKYEPFGDEIPMAYGSKTSGCDTIVITDNLFTLITHDSPSYNSPHQAAGFLPLGNNNSYLSLFGF